MPAKPGDTVLGRPHTLKLDMNSSRSTRAEHLVSMPYGRFEHGAAGTPPVWFEASSIHRNNPYQPHFDCRKTTARIGPAAAQDACPEAGARGSYCCECGQQRVASCDESTPPCVMARMKRQSSQAEAPKAHMRPCSSAHDMAAWQSSTCDVQGWTDVRSSPHALLGLNLLSVLCFAMAAAALTPCAKGPRVPA